MKRILIALPIILLVGLLVSPASAETTRQLVPFRTTVRSCSGERVHLAGQILLIENFFQSSDGRIHDNFTLAPRNVIGVSASGVVYRAVGGLRETFNISGSGTVTDTFTTEFIVVSENGDENLQIVETFHVTVAPDGTVTAIFDHFYARCI
jgi:hypothetical protein